MFVLLLVNFWKQEFYYLQKNACRLLDFTRIMYCNFGERYCNVVFIMTVFGQSENPEDKSDPESKIILWPWRHVLSLPSGLESWMQKNCHICSWGRLNHYFKVNYSPEIKPVNSVMALNNLGLFHKQESYVCVLIVSNYYY